MFEVTMTLEGFILCYCAVIYIVSACHAEANALLRRNVGDVSDCEIFITHFPCNECTKLIIRSGIKTIIYSNNDTEHKEKFIASKWMLEEAGVVCKKFDTTDVNDGGKADQISWTKFMSVASLAAKRSKDPCRDTQVGACIVNSEDNIVAEGCNGMPLGCSNEEFPWGKPPANKLETKNLYDKLSQICHAEANAILDYKKNLGDFNNAKIFVTQFPCNECAKLIIQSGIKRVIYGTKDNVKDEIKASERMLNAAGVNHEQHVTELTGQKTDKRSASGETSQCLKKTKTDPVHPE